MPHTLETIMELADDYAGNRPYVKRSALETAIREVLAERDVAVGQRDWLLKQNAANFNRAEKAEAECGRLRKDAERYRWLRDAHPADGGLWVAMGVPHFGLSAWRIEPLDAAIDAAMKDQP
jgi:hypothetical protein